VAYVLLDVSKTLGMLTVHRQKAAPICQSCSLSFLKFQFVRNASYWFSCFAVRAAFRIRGSRGPASLTFVSWTRWSLLCRRWLCREVARFLHRCVW
jgi:hypothetical protein